MRDFFTSFKWITKIGVGYAVFLGVALTVFSALIISDSKLMGRAVMMDMEKAGEITSEYGEQAISSYLQTCIEAVELTGHGVEKLLDEQVPMYDVQKYIEVQSENYTEVVDPNYTGIYGYIRGKYLDGSGWKPDAGYDPTSRPWYTDALAAGGQAKLVDPYMDMQTKKVAMSVSKLLADQSSVISVDVSLAKVQEMTEEILRANSKTEVMLITSDGTIVAHSVESRTLGNVFGKTELLHGHTIDELKNATQRDFKVTFKGKHYYVYFKEVYDGWFAISQINIDAALAEKSGIVATHVIAIILLWGSLFGLFVNVGKRRFEATKNYSQMYSISGIYTTMDLINLEEDTFQMIRCDGEELRDSQEGMTVGAHRIMRETMWVCTAESSQNKLFNFIDLKTLDERMSDTDTISIEYLDNNNKWCRGRFTVVERNKHGKLKSVLWMIEPIDKEKREREHLEWLSETDRLTGIMNRGGGEEKIRQVIETGGKGMLAILDADHFKSINDTFGHQVGDAVIIAIANCMKKSFRDVDVVMRLGGDEFSVFLSDIQDRKIAEQILGRFIDNIHAISIPQITDRKIEVSVGAAFLDQSRIKDFETLYKSADSGVYKSKKTVGSCVTFSEDIAEAPKQSS